MAQLQASLAVLLVQLLAAGAARWLSGRRALLERGLHVLVSVAVGVLLATALLHILPEGIAALGNRRALWGVFAGTIFVLFCIERISAVDGIKMQDAPAPGGLGGHGQRRVGSRPVGLVIGSVVHSFVDGVSVAAAFAAGWRSGWLTAFAIALHEVPHRMGDYALLRHLQVPERRVRQTLVLIGVAALVGVLLVVLAGHTFAGTAWLLPLSAGSFVYIALANLMPELAGSTSLRAVLLELLGMVAAALLTALLLQVPGS